MISKTIMLNAFCSADSVVLDTPEGSCVLVCLSICTVSGERIVMDVTYRPMGNPYTMNMNCLCYTMEDEAGRFMNTYISISKDFRYVEIYCGEVISSIQWNKIVKAVLSVLLLAAGVLIAWGTIDSCHRFVIGSTVKDKIIAFTELSIFNQNPLVFMKRDTKSTTTADISPQKKAGYLFEDIYTMDNPYIINTAYVHTNQADIVNKLNELWQNCAVLEEKREYEEALYGSNERTTKRIL